MVGWDTGGGLQGGLAGIDDSAGHLEGDLAGAEAVLLDEDDLLVGGEGDDVDPRVGFEDVEVMLALGTRRAAAIFAQPEDSIVSE